MAVDGSEYSQHASLWGFALAKAVDARVEAINVVDPRIVDLFLSPEFAEELGFKESIDASAQIIKGLRKVGGVVLDLWKKEHQSILADDGSTYLEVGDIADEIVKRGKDFDLTIVGHRGLGQRKHMPAVSHIRLGSIAERVAVTSAGPVLVALDTPDEIESVLVAYDGSEPAKGALLMAEQLAMALSKTLNIVSVARDRSLVKDAESTLALAASLFRHHTAGERSDSKESKTKTKLREAKLTVEIGHPARTLLSFAEQGKALIVLGAYGFSDPEQNVLGSTTTQVIRSTRSSVLVYRFKSSQM